MYKTFLCVGYVKVHFLILYILYYKYYIILWCAIVGHYPPTQDERVNKSVVLFDKKETNFMWSIFFHDQRFGISKKILHA